MLGNALDNRRKNCYNNIKGSFHKIEWSGLFNVIFRKEIA